MSEENGILLEAEKPRHKDGVRLDVAWKEDADARKALTTNGIVKRANTLAGVAKATDGTDAGDGQVAPGPTTPDDAQMAKIEPFLRSPKKPEELAVLPVLSLNNLEDRDEDRFTDDCVDEFHALEAPYSFIGKSYMLDHNYSTFNAIGRIFDEAVKDANGIKWLTHEVYVPNTPQFQPYLERVDFGIAWANSVGVMLGKSACSVCGAGFSSYGYWCANGHDKGYFYLEDGETDQWGYPLPTDSRTPGATKCIREFSEPKDGYELSQVYLGAQYFAGLDKDAKAAVTKAARSVEIPKEFGGMKIPIIGLKSAEAESLPFRHEPVKVTEARKQFNVETQADGGVRWVDDDKFIWTFDPSDEDPEVRMIGAQADAEIATTNKEGETDGEHPIPNGDGSEGQGVLDGATGDLALSEGSGEDPLGQGGSEAVQGDAPEVADADPKAAETEGEHKTAKDLRFVLDRAKKLSAKTADSSDLSDEAEALALSLGVLTEDIEISLGTDTADDAELSESDVELMEATEDAAEALETELGIEADPEEVPETAAPATNDTKSISRKALRSGIPAVLVGKWAATEEPTMDSLLLMLGSELKSLGSGGTLTKETQRKIAAGESYLKELRSDCKRYYALAHRDPKAPDRGVSMESFEKVLSRVGDDAQMLMSLRDENKALAEQKYPAGGRRSAAPSNPETGDGPAEIPVDKTVSQGQSSATADRLHSK